MDLNELSSTIEAHNDEVMEEYRKKIEVNEKEAMRRFFAGMEPNFSHCCIDEENKPLTAGYGKLDDWGHWEYPLPEPVDQWRSISSKEHDLIIKFENNNYKVRIVPFNCNEIIKRNFLHYCYWNSDKLPKNINVLQHRFKEYIEHVLKADGDTSDFTVCNSVGELVCDHKSRIYLEIIDEAYIPRGKTFIEWLYTGAK